jgi:hypothetical protein
VSGPTGAVGGSNPVHDKWVTCDPAQIGDAACAEQVLRDLAPKAWRRPLTEAELTDLIGISTRVLDEGGTFEDALKWGVVSVLVSPNFLYRVEIDPDPTSSTQHPISSYELASRLSYFLWSSMPDDELFDAAARDELKTPEQLQAQVERMLADPKAQALVDNFGGQWLFIRGLDAAVKDPATFPGFDDALKASMKEEMNRFFESFVFTPRDTLLYNSLCTFSSEISDGDRHNHDDLPVLLGGRGGGYVANPGRNKTYDNAPIADLYLAMLEAQGASVGTFGSDGSEPLDLS